MLFVPEMFRYCEYTCFWTPCYSSHSTAILKIIQVIVFKVIHIFIFLLKIKGIKCSLKMFLFHV